MERFFQCLLDSFAQSLSLQLQGVNTMLMMLGAAKPIFRLPYTFVPRLPQDFLYHDVVIIVVMLCYVTKNVSQIFRYSRVAQILLCEIP